MTNQNTDVLEMQQLLEQHDYTMPQVGDIREGVIVAKTNQGLIIDLGLKHDGVVKPADLSKLAPAERDALAVGDEVHVYITDTEQEDALDVSIYLAQRNQDWIKAETLLDNGDIVELNVVEHNKGGVVVSFGRLRGFVPLSHLTLVNSRAEETERQQQLTQLHGEQLPVKVLEVNRRRRRLILSQREAQREWEEKRKRELLQRLHEGDVISGRVSGLRDFGAFVDLGGADGLIHISELAWYRVSHPRDVLQVGDEIDVYVLKLDRKSERISLSLKKLRSNPWDTVAERYQPEQLVECTITRVVDYGAFAALEPGVEGLLHISELSHAMVDRVSDVVQESETHLLRVVSLDAERQRIGLSLKAVTAEEQIAWMANREEKNEIKQAEEISA